MKRKTNALLKAIILLPGNAVVVIPGVLLYFEGGIIPGWGVSPLVVIAGTVFLAFGLAVAIHTVRLFLKHGEGTPAPWEPPRKLVVLGAYRHVRNPMISSVLSVLLGEAFVLGSTYILLWCAVFFVLNHFYFRLFEEPELERRFGAEYVEYKRKVPRWIPRLRPWRGSSGSREIG